MKRRRLGKNGLEVSAQVALAWLSWIVPIPGTTKLHRLEENLGADAIQRTAEDLRDIDVAISKIDVHGLRLPDAVLKDVGTLIQTLNQSPA
ncbi:MAG TPA: hypothetical protein VFA67_15280 [Candidatus Sulfotelmatobacter sp.]|nr:hypothetical protein [Candidatus Sulfotelmatobacter sp.]